MAYLLSPLYNDAQFDSAGDPLVGGKLYWYQAGTTTPATVYTDATGATSHANPIILNARGEAASPIYLDDSLSYKAVLADADDAVIRTIDGIDGIGTSGGGAVSEWTVFGGAPTYVDADEFSVAGDQTAAFHVGRRVRLTLSGSTLYGTIAASSYASATTVRVTLDSGSLDGTLSAVAYGLGYSNTAVPVSVPLQSGNSGKYLTTNGTTASWGEVVASGTWTPTVTTISNASSASSSTSRYTRVGNIVTCSGPLNIAPSGAAVTVEVRLTLPIPTTFAGSARASGTWAFAGGLAWPGQISSVSGGALVSCTYYAESAAAASGSFIFQYVIE